MKISIIIVLSLFLTLIYSCEKDEVIPKDITPVENHEFPSDEGKDTIWVSNVSELMATEKSTKGGNKVVLIKDGTYNVTDRLYLTGNDLIFRSESGDRNKVLLIGEGMNGDIGWIFSVLGKNFATKDISIGKVRYHGIQVHGEANADNVYIQNVRFFDIRQQMIKGSFDENTPQQYADSGIVEGCLFEYTRGHSYDYYCGGIDIHHGINWRVSNNTFRNIQTNDNSLTEGAIHFWNNSEGTLVENNIIYNCDRGIMFGMDNSPHKDGLIRNNMIVVTKDVGIYLCYAPGAKVYYNTVYNNSDYQNSIECRFEYTKGCELYNNLCNNAITLRNEASADITNNVNNASQDWFINVQNGDLHLKSAIEEVADKALDLEEVIKDIDGETRNKGTSDIGADEF
jgi:hypothetical protein